MYADQREVLAATMQSSDAQSAIALTMPLKTARLICVVQRATSGAIHQTHAEPIFADPFAITKAIPMKNAGNEKLCNPEKEQAE